MTRAMNGVPTIEDQRLRFPPTRPSSDQRGTGPRGALARGLGVVLVAVLAVVSVASEADARRRNAVGDYVKAARLLADWRYDEARRAIAALEKRAPRRAETRYLGAELAFIDGDYPRVLELLEGLDDDDAQGNIGRLRALATSTHAVTRDFARRESSGGHFVIYYAPGKDELIADLAGDVLEAAYRELGRDFGWHPGEKIRVELLGQPSDLARLSTLTREEIETTGTIALCKYGKLMVVSPRATMFGYPWMDTLVHEYVHYVVSRMSHDTVPVWLHEGLARFQQSRWRTGPETRLSGVEEHLLATGLASRKLVSFDDMHPSMAKLPSAEAAALAFAEVYTMVGYLHEQVGYPGLREIIDATRDGKSARRAVAEVMDMPWARVERSWKTHLRRLDLQSNRALDARARGPRVRFKAGDGDTENVGVDEVASAQARKHARLGGMLRARGMSEAAAIEYERALALTGKGDPFVAAKLSRTYLELERYTDAIALAEPLASADENDAAPAVTLGVAHAARGDHARARLAFEAALRISPFDPTVRCGLAEIYALQGEASLATREERACAQLRP